MKIETYEIVDVDFRPDLLKLPLIEQLNLLLFALNTESRENILNKLSLVSESDTYSPNARIKIALDRATEQEMLHEVWDLALNYFSKMKDIKNPFPISAKKYN
jgi:hypothetical protein